MLGIKDSEHFLLVYFTLDISYFDIT